MSIPSLLKTSLILLLVLNVPPVYAEEYFLQINLPGVDGNNDPSEPMFSGAEHFSIPSLSLSGDYEIEFVFEATSGNQDDKYRILGKAGGWSHQVEPSSDEFTLYNGGADETRLRFSGVSFSDGIQAKVRVVRTGNNIKVYKDTNLIVDYDTPNSGTLNPDQIGRVHDTDYYLGDISYLEVIDNEDSLNSRYYDFSQFDGSTVPDTMNGLDATLIE